MDLFAQLSDTATTVIDTAGPSIVVIGRQGRGTGIVVAAGRVVTNAHNLRDRSTQVTFADGSTAQASLAGADVDGDLAVLDVDTGDVAPMTWGSESPPSTGHPVFALSRSLDGSLRATFGTVSSTQRTFRGPRGRRVSDAFEHTAPLARGSSGGPVADIQGRLIGLNTSRLAHGFYLAVPTHAEFRERVEALAGGISPQRARLGVGLAPSEVANRLRRAVGLPQRDGLLVQTVAGGSAAATAGIARGDLLVAAADQPLQHIDDLMAVLEGRGPGESLTLTVVRGTEERPVTVAFEATSG